jgi:hexosaminidase
MPVSWKPREGYLEFAGLPKIIHNAVFTGETGTFQEDLEADFNCKLSSTAGDAEITCEKVDGLGDEAYRLKIKANGMLLSASAGGGLWHGLQTIRQLLLSGADSVAFQTEGDFNKSAKFRIPLGEVEDYPRFPWRGYMLDCSRNFYTPAFIKKILCALSLHHINVFHWHLTDDQGWRLPVKGYPLLTEIGSRRRDHRRHDRFTGGFYSEEDIREIVAFAAARHIEVVPEVDIPGHTSSVLACYPGLGCTGGPYRVEDRYGIFEDVLCAGNDAVFDLAAAVFDSLTEVFPSKYIHIGGDEVRFNNWAACPKCQKRLVETGLKTPRELQSWITVQFARMLADRGKTGIGWDEVLEDTEKYPLPKEMIVMSWRGREAGIAGSRLGHRVIMAPKTEGCYLDYRHNEEPEEPGQLGICRLSQIYNMDPVSPGISAEEAGHILGGQGNLWSEIIYAGKIAEYMTFPRICALAESLWLPGESKDLVDFARRLPAHRDRLDKLGILHYRGSL